MRKLGRNSRKIKKEFWESSFLSQRDSVFSVSSISNQKDQKVAKQLIGLKQKGFQ